MIDKEIVQRAIAGEQSALEELYCKTYSVTYALAYQILRCDEAEDIVQEAYISAFANLNRLHDPEKFDVWIKQIVSNRCKDFFKKKKPTLFTEMEDSDGDILFDIEDQKETFHPEAAVDYGETKRIVQDLLDELPEEQKMCLLMFYGSEMTIPEIAAALSIPESTVKSRLNYGRKKMQDRVSEFEKKNDIRLHGVAPFAIFGFLRWMQKGSQIQPSAEAVSAVVQNSISAGAKVASTVGTVAKTVDTVKKVGGAAKVMATIGKTVAGVACAGAVATGVVAVVESELLYPVDFLGIITPAPIQVVQKFEKAVDEWDYDDLLECIDPKFIEQVKSEEDELDSVLSEIGLFADFELAGGFLKKLMKIEMDLEIHDCTYLEDDYAVVQTTCRISSKRLDFDESEPLELPLRKIDGKWYIVDELPNASETLNPEGEDDFHSEISETMDAYFETVIKGQLDISSVADASGVPYKEMITDEVRATMLKAAPENAWRDLYYSRGYQDIDDILSQYLGLYRDYVWGNYKYNVGTDYSISYEIIDQRQLSEDEQLILDEKMSNTNAVDGYALDSDVVKENSKYRSYFPVIQKGSLEDAYEITVKYTATGSKQDWVREGEYVAIKTNGHWYITKNGYYNLMWDNTLTKDMSGAWHP